MEDLNKAVRKEGALRGLLFGGLMLLIDILKLYFLANVPASPMVVFAVLYPVYYIVLFGAALLFIFGLRKKIGHYWTLKQAITGIFIMLFITSMIWNNGIALFSGIINPTLAQKAHVAFVDARVGAMQSSHTPATKIATEVASMNQKFAASRQFSPQGFIQSLFISIILIFAVSAVFGVLFKRERPAASAS
jgi:hypothetical protein